MRQLRIAMAQINTTVGDFNGNTQKILKAIDEARSLSIDIITFPELAICGYPPEDLLFKQHFIEENLRCLDKVIAGSSGVCVIVGFVDAKDDIYNAAAVIHNGSLAGVYHKIYLPNYGISDEDRYFREGSECPIFVINGINVGISICEDIWYEAGPATIQAYSGAEVIVNISASPYHVGRPYHHGRRYLRQSMVESRAADNVAIVVYNNLVGGQDQLVFDGNSLVVDEKGMLIAEGKRFEEDLILVDLDIDAVFSARLQDPRWRKTTLLTEEQHATRIVISEEPLTEYTPLQRASKSGDQDTVMTQYSMESIARIGWLKMDFLGLANLSSLAKAREIISQTRGFLSRDRRLCSITLIILSGPHQQSVPRFCVTKR